MPETERIIECGECGQILGEADNQDSSEREPCPNCGSLRHPVRLKFSETLTFREKNKLKAKGTEGGRYA